MRKTWVSTTMPSAFWNDTPRTTLAVLRAAPGMVTISARVCGTWPLKSATILRAAPRMDLALLRKKPVVFMRDSSSGREAWAMAAGVGKRRKSSGVTKLTRTSVHWAERMVATRSSQGVRWVSAHWALG